MDDIASLEVGYVVPANAHIFILVHNFFCVLANSLQANV